MNAEEKLQIIRQRLTDHFEPNFLEVNDDSDQHIGHTGHQGGGRHFSVKICAKALSTKARVDAYREIYSLFTDLIPDEVHALSIKIIKG